MPNSAMIARGAAHLMLQEGEINMDLISGRCLGEEDKSRSRLIGIGRIFWIEGIMTGSPNVRNSKCRRVKKITLKYKKDTLPLNLN